MSHIRKGANDVNLEQAQKALFLTDIECDWHSLLQEITNILPENMLTIQCYGPVISNPYGDIMRSIIIAIYQEKVEEIYVVGTKNSEALSANVLIELDSMKEKIRTLDYLFQHSRPEFLRGTVHEWLNENSHDRIEKCVNIIYHHPLVPQNVKVRGLIIDREDGKPSIVEVSPQVTV